MIVTARPASHAVTDWRHGFLVCGSRAITPLAIVGATGCLLRSLAGAVSSDTSSIEPTFVISSRPLGPFNNILSWTRHCRQVQLLLDARVPASLHRRARTPSISARA